MMWPLPANATRNGIVDSINEATAQAFSIEKFPAALNGFKVSGGASVVNHCFKKLTKGERCHIHITFMLQMLNNGSDTGETSRKPLSAKVVSVKFE